MSPNTVDFAVFSVRSGIIKVWYYLDLQLTRMIDTYNVYVMAQKLWGTELID